MPIVDDEGYTLNTGVMPVEKGTPIDFVHQDGEQHYGKPCGGGSSSTWRLDTGDGTIVKWRLAQ